MSLEIAVQNAVISALNGSSELSEIVSTRIRDHIPQKTAFPFVQIGDDDLTMQDTSTTTGAAVLVTVHTWSNTSGRTETKEIQGEIYSALHQAELTNAGYIFHGCQFVSSQSFIDADGTTRHGVSVFSIQLDKEG